MNATLPLQNGAENSGRHARRIILGEDSTLAIALLAYLTFVQLCYFVLREKGIWLYFAEYISFHYQQWPVVFGVVYVVIFPLVYLFCRRAESDLFALILFPVVVIGGVSGSVVLLFSAEYYLFFLFLSYFIVVPAVLAMIRIPALPYPRIRIGRHGEGLFVTAGAISLLLYLFWAWKYRQILGLPGLADVYDYRHALKAAVDHWERYAMIFAKFVGAFSFGYVAITTGQLRYIIGSFAILLMDYMLGGHRASLGFAALVLASYLWFVFMRLRFKVSHIVIALAAFCASFGAALLLFGRVSPYAIGIYDRAFHVTVGLFVRYVDQAAMSGFYHGGDGLLGFVFGGNGKNYRTEIGERFFGEGVSANADLVSDAYINFGVVGPLVAFLILRLLISRRDADFFRRSREAVALFVVPYALALFSMGLQTALVTGALAAALIFMKIADVHSVRGRAVPFSSPTDATAQSRL